MLFKKILVPLDGSESSDNALKVALSLVGDDKDATITPILVVAAGAIATEMSHPTLHRDHNPYLFPGADSYKALIDKTTESARERLTQWVGTELDDAQCKVELKVTIAGKVTDGIVDYAREHGYELIVMGRTGRGMLRGMLGSVSYGVLRASEIPVLTVK